MSKGGDIGAHYQAYFLQRRKKGCKTVMKFEDYSGELKGNHARYDNRKGKYHEEPRPCVDEPKVPEKRRKSK